MLVLKYHACIMHASRWSEDTWMHCCIFFAYQFCEPSLRLLTFESRKMSRLCQRCFCSITLLRQHSYPLHTYTSYTHTTQIQDVGGTRVCSCSVVLSTFAVNSGYCGLNFIGLYCCGVIHILRADTLYDVANILTAFCSTGLRRICYLWSQLLILSCRRLSLVVFTFSFFVLVFSWWLILTLHSK